MKDIQLLSGPDVAKTLGLSEQTVSRLARQGRIRAAITTSSGWRLFENAELERLKQYLDFKRCSARSA